MLRIYVCVLVDQTGLSMGHDAVEFICPSEGHAVKLLDRLRQLGVGFYETHKDLFFHR